MSILKSSKLRHFIMYLFSMLVSINEFYHGAKFPFSRWKTWQSYDDNIWQNWIAQKHFMLSLMRMYSIILVIIYYNR